MIKELLEATKKTLEKLNKEGITSSYKKTNDNMNYNCYYADSGYTSFTYK